MKKIFVTLLISAISVIGFAQQQAVIKREAQQMADAFVKGDFAKTVTYIYPKVVDKWGGKAVVLKSSRNFSARLQSSGLAINSITAGDAGNIQMIGSRKFCLLNDRITINTNGTAISSNLGVLAVSENKGTRWYFISAGMVSDETLYHFFPEIKGKIVLPKPAIPMVPGNE